MSSKTSIFLSGGFKSDWQAKLFERYEGKFQFYNPREHKIASIKFIALYERDSCPACRSD